jgi:hypothetical protein
MGTATDPRVGGDTLAIHRRPRIVRRAVGRLERDERADGAVASFGRRPVLDGWNDPWGERPEHGCSPPGSTVTASARVRCEVNTV